MPHSWHVSAAFFSLYLEANQVYTLGSNQYGQLGIEDMSKIKSFPVLVDLKRVTLIACGGNCSFAILESGQVLSWGEGLNGATGLGKP